MEREILKIINTEIAGNYTGKLKVHKETEDGVTFWTLLLYLDTEMTPLILACEGSEEDFKTFVAEEIRDRKLQGVQFWKGIKEYRNE